MSFTGYEFPLKSTTSPLVYVPVLFFYKHKAQESSRLELIAGEDINCYKYFTDLFNSKQDSEFDQYLYDQSRKTIHELSDLCKDNAWIKYFSEVYKSREQKGKDGWIDFESEISLPQLS